MSRHALDDYVDVVLMLGLALIFRSLRLITFRVRGLCTHIALTVGGHLRPRPDPAIEQALRSAFAEFDRELSLILGNRDQPNGLSRAR